MQKIYLKIKDHWLFWVITIFLGAILGKIISNINFNAKGFLLFLLNILKIKIPIAGLLLGAFIAWFSIIFYRKVFVFRRRRLKILRAYYGLGDKFIDITNELNEAIIDNKLNIVLSNNIAGDPYVTKVKIGKIKYQFDGKENYREYREGEVIELPSVDVKNNLALGA
jgi:hypothetical protein